MWVRWHTGGGGGGGDGERSSMKVCDMGVRENKVWGRGGGGA